jgi:hypothetical protein
VAVASKYAASYLLARHAAGDDSLEAEELEDYTQRLVAAGYGCALALLSFTSVDQVAPHTRRLSSARRAGL